MAATPSPRDVANQPDDDNNQRKEDSALTLQNPNQTNNTLRFIDESERRTNVEDFKRNVRSHVRRGSHARQRRLNESTKPRLLGQGVRKLAQKSNGMRAGGSKLQKQKDVATSASREGFLTPYSSRQVSRISAGLERLMTQNVIDNPGAEPLPRIGGQGHASIQSPYSAIISRAGRPFCSPFLPSLQFDNTTPYALLLGDGIPSLQMQGRNWPFLHPIRGIGPAISVWMPAGNIPIPNARSPRPCLLQNAQPVSFMAESVDYFRFKDVIVKWVNQRLGNGGNATSDVTIGVILCLMSWEISRGNAQELALHMNGLLQIINLRGGLQNLASIRQFCWKIQLIDLIVALQANSDPLFPSIQLPAPSPPPHLNMSIGTFQIPDSPLFGAGPFENLLATSPFDQQSRQILQHMRDITYDHGQQFQRYPLQHLDPHPSSLSKMIYFTSTIYGPAFSHRPIPFASIQNNLAVRELCAGLEDTTNDETWTRYPGILLWVALTATAAAANMQERSFFAMFIVRVGTSAAWWGTEAAGAAIRKFIYVKRRAEGLGGR